MVKLKNILMGICLLPGISQAAGPVPECTVKRPVVQVSGEQPAFTVRLASNPTTGYRWFLQSTPEDVKPEGAVFVPSSRKGLVGAPGEEVWRFSVAPSRVPRQFSVQLVYARPFEPGSGQPFECKVSVLP